jgi:deazaflavin-dependent oxidoreductase (nitroreductase family)
MFRDRMRIVNKYVTNKVFRVFASRSRGPFAVMRHVGRRSGKPYETTLMVWHLGEGFVIALTYGANVDWYRNVVAAGGGTLLWHGRVYAIGKPEPIDARTALTAFPAFFRFVLGRTGTHEFVWVKSSSVSEPARA